MQLTQTLQTLQTLQTMQTLQTLLTLQTYSKYTMSFLWPWQHSDWVEEVWAQGLEKDLVKIWLHCLCWCIYLISLHLTLTMTRLFSSSMLDVITYICPSMKKPLLRNSVDWTWHLSSESCQWPCIFSCGKSCRNQPRKRQFISVKGQLILRLPSPNL